MMLHWWETPSEPQAPAMPRAVAYYRHSAQDRQENSIPIQQEQVRQWAADNGVEIIEEFADAGRSGLTAEGRPAFTHVVKECTIPATSGGLLPQLKGGRRARCRVPED